jgi:hypothetical protein
MSQASNQIVKSLIAGEDLSDYQYHAVMIELGTSNTVIKAGTPAAEGTHVIGVLQNEPEDGEAASVAIGGTSKLIMAADCDAGEKLMSSSGKGTPVDADQKSVIGIALEDNDEGDGGIIEVLLTPGGIAQADESD